MVLLLILISFTGVMTYVLLKPPDAARQPAVRLARRANTYRHPAGVKIVGMGRGRLRIGRAHVDESIAESISESLLSESVYVSSQPNPAKHERSELPCTSLPQQSSRY